MDKIEEVLQTGERIVYSGYGACRGSIENIGPYSITNKNLIFYSYEEIKKFFKTDYDIVDVEKFALSKIKNINGNARVLFYDYNDPENGYKLEIIFSDGPLLLFFEERSEALNAGNTICHIISDRDVVIIPGPHKEKKGLFGRNKIENQEKPKEMVYKFCDSCGAKASGYEGTTGFCGYCGAPQKF